MLLDLLAVNILESVWEVPDKVSGAIESAQYTSHQLEGGETLSYKMSTVFPRLTSRTNHGKYEGEAKFMLLL